MKRRSEKKQNELLYDSLGFRPRGYEIWPLRGKRLYCRCIAKFACTVFLNG